MALLSKWITQIIVLMLIGTIVELLLPDNRMRKYVNLVSGLLMLLILTQPILYLFSVDMTKMIHQVEETLFDTDTSLETSEKKAKSQKEDIESTQDAYIWNEISSQLIQSANEVLEDTHEMTVTGIEVETNEDESDIENIVTTVAPTSVKNENGDTAISIRSIDVDIDTKEMEKESLEEKKGQVIKEALAEAWDVDSSQIQLLWEGQID